MDHLGTGTGPPLFRDDDHADQGGGTQPTRTVAARIAVDLKIFETAVADGGRPKTNAELAAPTGASPTLVKRIARVCVSMRMLDERGPGLYAPNSLTSLLARPEYAAGIVFWYVLLPPRRNAAPRG